MSHLSSSNTGVLSELLERVRSAIKSLNVGNVLINVIEALLLRGGTEENGSISSLDGVLLDWWLVVLGGLNNLNITNREGLEQRLIQGLSLWSFASSRPVGLRSRLSWWWGWWGISWNLLILSHGSIIFRFLRLLFLSKASLGKQMRS